MKTFQQLLNFDFEQFKNEIERTDTTMYFWIKNNFYNRNNGTNFTQQQQQWMLKNQGVEQQQSKEKFS